MAIQDYNILSWMCALIWKQSRRCARGSRMCRFIFVSPCSGDVAGRVGAGGGGQDYGSITLSFTIDPAPSAVLAPLPPTPPSRPTSPRHHVTGSPRSVQSADRRAPRVRLRRSRPPRLRAAGTGPPSSDGIVNKMLQILTAGYVTDSGEFISYPRCSQ